jgi:glutamyl-tRNA synthetase
MSLPIVRFPPSPTGFLHVGGARTALFNYLFARKLGGTFLVRIEDTDRERSKPEFEKNILEGLEWLGLSHDGTILRQSERGEVYKKYLRQLVEDGYAYVSQEAPREEGGRSEVIRFKNPNTRVGFNDLVRGPIEFDTTELKDFIIAKSFDEPLYHLAVVVDDFESGITHVIRGEDHISNTPRQILLQRAIGAPQPVYAHIPLILATDRSKLSKRKHGEAVSVPYFKQRGYLPQAFNNFLALCGWNPGTEQEIFTLEQLIKAFDIERVQKGGAIFNLEKLNWVNKEHIKLLGPQERQKALKQVLPDISDEILAKAESAILERVSTFGEVAEGRAAGDFDFYFSDPHQARERLLWQKEPSAEKTAEHLKAVSSLLETAGKWDAESLKTLIFPYAESSGKGAVLWPLRMALSGKDKSPDPFTLLSILGKDISLRRIAAALAVLR